MKFDSAFNVKIMFGKKYKIIYANPYDGTPLMGGGNGIMITTKWSKDFMAVMIENNVKHLYLNYTLGWACDNYSFFEQIPLMQSINIIDIHAHGISSISVQRDLIDLSINMHVTEKIDFSNLSKIKKLYVFYSKNIEGVSSCTQIEDLHLDNFKFNNIADAFDLRNLKKLVIANSIINNIDFLVNVESIEKIELLNCNYVSDFSPIGSCQKLKWLRLDGRKGLESIDFVSSLLNLEVCILKIASIESVSPLENLRNLKALSFLGSKSVIINGDFSILAKLPNLSMFMIPAKKHYSHKPSKPWNWENYELGVNILKNRKNLASGFE